MSMQLMRVIRDDELARRVSTIRGVRVMLDTDLAAVYGVSVKRLNEQVKRNARRFPMDFCFRLTLDEAAGLRSQFATSNVPRGGRRSPPVVFTEHGAVMIASVLNSSTAIKASIQVVRVFVQMRSVIAAHRTLSRRIDELEQRFDARFKVVFDSLRKLTAPPAVPARLIGFSVRHRAGAAKAPGRRRAAGGLR